MAKGQRATHAVVIGASMAGLAIARALTEQFHVTIVDRDRLPEGPDGRNGVPQGRHAHILLTAGADALDALFPGLTAELATDGAPTTDSDRVRFCLNGHRLAPSPVGREAVLASRPFVEAHVRQRIRDDPAIDLLDGVEVRELATTPDDRRVIGARVTSRDEGGAEEVIPADLVVDCSGRRSRTPDWLAAMGYEPPAVDELPIELRYASRQYGLSADVLDGDRLVLVGPTPDGPRGAVMMYIEHDRWLVTLFGLGGERPSLEPGGFAEFADRLPVGDVAEAIRGAAALDDPAGFRYPANMRPRYDRLAEFPAGLLVAGDALCSFNPIYGQGMSVAALEAVTLRQLLRRQPEVSPQEWFAAAAPVVDGAWDLAIGGDLAIRCIEGRRSLAVRMQNRYVARLHAAAVQDPALTLAFVRVIALLDPPPHILRPGVVGRVLRGNLRRASAGPRRIAQPASSG